MFNKGLGTRETGCLLVDSLQEDNPSAGWWTASRRTVSQLAAGRTQRSRAHGWTGEATTPTLASASADSATPEET